MTENTIGFGKCSKCGGEMQPATRLNHATLIEGYLFCSVCSIPAPVSYVDGPLISQEGKPNSRLQRFRYRVQEFKAYSKLHYYIAADILGEEKIQMHPDGVARPQRTVIETKYWDFESNKFVVSTQNIRPIGFWSGALFVVALRFKYGKEKNGYRFYMNTTGDMRFINAVFGSQAATKEDFR